MDGSLKFEADGPTIVAVRMPNGGKALQQTGGVMRHGVDYIKHRPVGNPKRKV
jgi:hypothetical protein